MTDFMDKLELVAALLKARQGFDPMVKSGSHSQFGKYAKLSDVLNAIEAALTENGLCILQPPDIKDGVTCLHTILLHKSGQSIESWYPIKEDMSGSKNELQAEGSGITYQRKYSICMLLGIDWGQDDRDGSRGHQGNAESDMGGASGGNVGDVKNDLIKLEKKVIAGGMTQEEVDIVKKAMLGAKGFDNLKEVLVAYGDDLLAKSELPPKDLQKALYGADDSPGETESEEPSGTEKARKLAMTRETEVLGILNTDREKGNMITIHMLRAKVLGKGKSQIDDTAEAWLFYKGLLDDEKTWEPVADKSSVDELEEDDKASEADDA